MQILFIYALLMLAIVALGLCAVVGAAFSLAIYEAMEWAWQRVRPHALARGQAVLAHIFTHH